MKIVTALAIFAAAAGAARADEVVLRNGARFEGQVKETGDTVTVTLDIGTITFKKLDVARVVRGSSALSKFDEKIAELKVDDLDGRYKLGLWALQRGLGNRAGRTFEEIVVRDPDHVGAREALGYRQYGGRWMTEEEIKVEKGLVLFRGEWIRREVVDEIRRIEAERAAATTRDIHQESLKIRAAEAEPAANRAQEEEARSRIQAKRDRCRRETYIVYPGFGYRIPLYRRRPDVNIGPTPWPKIGPIYYGYRDSIIR